MREKAEKREDIGKVRELFMEREKREIMRKERRRGSYGERGGRGREPCFSAGVLT